jgi:hypothetical protein
MGTDEKDKGVVGTAAAEAKGVLVEVYRDVGRPALAPVGHVVGGLVNLVLWPVKLALDSANAKLGQLSAGVEAKLAASNVPAERLLPVPPPIAGPALPDGLAEGRAHHSALVLHLLVLGFDEREVLERL